MISLPYRRTVEPPAPVPAAPCGADSYYWVTTPAGVQRASCGPHLHHTITQFRTEGGQTAEQAPEPGTPCDYQEAH